MTNREYIARCRRRITYFAQFYTKKELEFYFSEEDKRLTSKDFNSLSALRKRADKYYKDKIFHPATEKISPSKYNCVHTGDVAKVLDHVDYTPETDLFIDLFNFRPLNNEESHRACDDKTNVYKKFHDNFVERVEISDVHLEILEDIVRPLLIDSRTRLIKWFGKVDSRVESLDSKLEKIDSKIQLIKNQLEYSNEFSAVFKKILKDKGEDIFFTWEKKYDENFRGKFVDENEITSTTIGRECSVFCWDGRKGKKAQEEATEKLVKGPYLSPSQKKWLRKNYKKFYELVKRFIIKYIKGDEPMVKFNQLDVSHSDFENEGSSRTQYIDDKIEKALKKNGPETRKIIKEFASKNFNLLLNKENEHNSKKIQRKAFHFRQGFIGFNCKKTQLQYHQNACDAIRSIYKIAGYPAPNDPVKSNSSRVIYYLMKYAKELFPSHELCQNYNCIDYDVKWGHRDNDEPNNNDPEVIVDDVTKTINKSTENKRVERLQRRLLKIKLEKLTGEKISDEDFNNAYAEEIKLGDF